MNFLMGLLVLAAQSDSQPYPLGAAATQDGAKSTVARLLDATTKKDDVAFDKIARGMVIMLAPDFGAPVDRAMLEQSLESCTAPVIVSSRPFPGKPQAQAVRISMHCKDKAHPKGVDAIADIMADNDHALVMLPGGVENVWPKKAKP